MFEIKLSRYHDGRYLATIPDLHTSCTSVANTAIAAVRGVQRTAFNILADFIQADRPLPEAMRCWFHTVTEEGTTHVGGCRNKEHPECKLIHKDNNVIPAPPKSLKKLALPKHGTPEYEEFLREMRGNGPQSANRLSINDSVDSVDPVS